MPEGFLLATAIAPTLRSSQLLTPARGLRRFGLSLLRAQALSPQLDDSPRVAAAPERVERAVAGADGTTWFVPQARIAERSKATRAPYVFLAKSDGAVTLQVWFDLVRFASLPTGSAALPVDGYSVSLVAESGDRIDFERCDDLPAVDQPESVLSRLFCETPVDANRAVTMLQAPGTRFRVEGNVHYTIAGAPAEPGPDLGVQLLPTGPMRVFRRATAIADAGALSVARAHATLPGMALRGRGLRDSVLRESAVGDLLATATTDPAPAPSWSSHAVRLSLGAADNSGVAACFPPDVMNNRAIYAQVTSGFGAEPWSEWVDSPNGQFMDSPVPDQFYILPDEYRLAFDARTRAPSMLVLLVPPQRPEGDATPMGFGRDYKLRVRFSIVPWVDPARRERLRAEIARHSGIAYPQLLVGGIRGATCQLSAVLHELGSSLVGTAEAGVAVDGLGFDLVLDCTSEFYTTLTGMLVTDGVDAKVTATLVADADNPRTAGVPVSLRLDRPATDVLVTEVVPPPAPAEPAAGPAAEPVSGSGGEPAAEPATPEPAPPEPAAPEPAAPVPPPTVRVLNPLPYAVTVAQAVPTLLITDDSLPSPIGTVAATAQPASFTLPAATDIPSVVELTLVPASGDGAGLYGSAAVALLGVDIAIDPEQVLARAIDTGSSGSVSSDVEVRCYQLEHPDVLPPALADVFGVEVQLRRGEAADPVTVFLTRDQPTVAQQVAFSLADLLAGARPEQPSFQWRRRNLAGSGTGEWSAWEAITGRQLFVSPNGL
jgi:hypothetical protein